MYFLSLNNYINTRFIITSKYLIIITKNGIIKFTTNIFNFIFVNNNLYINLINYKLLKNNLYSIYYLNLLYTNYFKKQVNLNYYQIYLINFFSSLYYLTYTFNISINLKGIGYKFILENNLLKLRIGYSHFVIYTLNPEILCNLKNPTCLELYSNNKYLLKNLTSSIKLLKQHNLYKGTGIFYIDEIIHLKKKNLNKTKNAK